jgi:hypothetical protein
MELVPPSAQTRRDSISQSGEYEEFIRENQDFFQYGPSQKSIKMLDTLINSNLIRVEHKQQQLRHLILQIYQDTALNEFQIAIWSIIIEKFVWPDLVTDVRLSLIYAALHTKLLVGENIEFLIIKYSEKEESFREKFFAWNSSKNLSRISMKDINKKYENLQSGGENKLNYNYYVDEVILQYLPYSHLKKKKNEEKVKRKVEAVNEIVLPSPIQPVSIFDIDLLPPLPLIPHTSSNGSRISYFLAKDSTCSQYLNFDV